MKKLLIACCLFSGWMSNAAFADAAKDLQNRLGKVNSFHASFTQQVTGSDGANIQQGKGQLWVKRPNLFNWHMSSPDESELISDGKTLWFYSPFVEQVTATWLKNATSNTPFILITRNSPEDWDKYNVKQQGDSFQLTPKKTQGNLKQFAIVVTPAGVIKSFSAVEQDGQRSAYTLTGQQDNQVDVSKFQFTPPKGVTVDDQRQ